MKRKWLGGPYLSVKHKHKQIGEVNDATLVRAFLSIREESLHVLREGDVCLSVRHEAEGSNLRRGHIPTTLGGLTKLRVLVGDIGCLIFSLPLGGRTIL